MKRFLLLAILSVVLCLPAWSQLCQHMNNDNQTDEQDEQIVATINVHELILKLGTSVQISATTSPIAVNVHWISTNTDVALLKTIRGRLFVKANQVGEALIIATPEGQNVRPDTCHVTVESDPIDNQL